MKNRSSGPEVQPAFPSVHGGIADEIGIAVDLVHMALLVSLVSLNSQCPLCAQRPRSCSIVVDVDLGAPAWEQGKIRQPTRSPGVERWPLLKRSANLSAAPTKFSLTSACNLFDFRTWPSPSLPSAPRISFSAHHQRPRLDLHLRPDIQLPLPRLIAATTRWQTRRRISTRSCRCSV